MQFKLALVIFSGLILGSTAELRPSESRRGNSFANNNQNRGGNNGGNAGNNNGGAGNNNPQTSLTLLQSLVQSNSNLTGLEPGLNGSTTAGIKASIISPNNFINYCATSKKPLMNGNQIRTGACNPIGMGDIANFDQAPSSKMAFPKNGDTIAANTNFTALINIQNFVPGTFTNADSQYYTAPCQLDPSTGQASGHGHIYIQQLSSLDSTTPLPPKQFAFFLGLKGDAVNGQMSGAVTGLAAGVYKIGTIMTCANHQMLNGAIAQRASFDDVAYFTVTASGNATGNGQGQGQANNGGKGQATTTTTTAAATATSQGGKGATTGQGQNNNGKGANGQQNNNNGKGATNNNGKGAQGQQQNHNGQQGQGRNGGRSQRGHRHHKKAETMIAKRRIQLESLLN